MNKTQRGFALIEGLLIVLILAIIGFGGYYVWNTQKENKKVTDDTLKASNSQTASSNKNNSNTSGNEFFTIKEWGVRAPFAASLKPEYKITSQGQWTWAYFSSDILIGSDSKCTTGGGYGGLINRVASGQKLLGVSGPSDQTAEQAISSGAIKEYSHVGNYYYYYEYPQAACGTSDFSVTAQQETEAAVKQIAKSLQAVH